MLTELRSDPLPLRVGSDGDLRVGESRVHLEIVIAAHEAGEAAEEIAVSYDTLELADVYAVLAYYLRHRDEVQDSVARRNREADELRKRLEASGVSRPGVWAELRARRARTEYGNAEVGR